VVFQYDPTIPTGSRDPAPDVSRRRLPTEATRFLQRARLREAVAIVAARDGAAFLTVEDVAAEARGSRKTFYMFYSGAAEALEDAAAAGLDFGVRRIGQAFDAQRDRPLAIRAAVIEALVLSAAEPHWALLCVRDSHAEPIASVLDRSRRLAPLVDRLREHGSGNAPAWAAIDAVEGAIRHALTDGRPVPLRDLADELVALVLDLLGERRRGRGPIQRQERWLVARVDEAFDALPGSADELTKLLVAAGAAGDGAALWRAFVRLDELERTQGLSGDERRLRRTAFDGLKEAGHFGLPVMAIAAGAAPARWTPARPTPKPAGPGADANPAAYAPAGLFIQPLGDLEQAAMTILAQRPGITEDELGRALGVSQAQTRQIIGRLERGLVRRAPAA
jgi:hypothetical protein